MNSWNSLELLLSYFEGLSGPYKNEHDTGEHIYFHKISTGYPGEIEQMWSDGFQGPSYIIHFDVVILPVTWFENLALQNYNFCTLCLKKVIFFKFMKIA